MNIPNNIIKPAIMILILILVPVICLLIILSITPPVKEITYAHLVNLAQRHHVSSINVTHNRLDIYLTKEGEKAENIILNNENKHNFKDYVINNVELKPHQIRFFKQNGIKIETSQLNIFPFAVFVLIMIFLIGLARWKQQKYMIALQKAHPELSFESMTPEETKENLKETLQYLKEHHKLRYYLVIFSSLLPLIIILLMALILIIGTVSLMFK